MLDADIGLPKGWVCGRLHETELAAEAAYATRHASVFGPGALAGRRVALYERSSIARDALRNLLQALGPKSCRWVAYRHLCPDRHRSGVAGRRAQALEWAQAHRFDAIISTNGDADGPLIGDDAGAWLHGTW